ncbi:hypothetical protein DSO57_1000573 [Entomophthora muscae]|uniref:Uncharacterized protein n=1 Tax=Entomophthora muscae TaxID=34485 RepID=A0ACC2SBA0_9FUNG|nr:hypothetical protein DSO57_1000573 [Entomophthora muscae]
MDGDFTTVSPLENTVSRLNQVTASFSTCGGFDKALGLFQYSAKMLILLSKGGLNGNTGLATRLVNLARVISDARTLLRFRGSFPLLAQGLEASFGPKKISGVTLIMKLQLISMLIYYPLEHIYWLGAQGILPAKPKTIGTAAVWSCRAWFTYNVLEFINIREQFKLLSQKETSEGKDAKSTSSDRYRLLVQTFSLTCYTYMSAQYSFDSPFNPTSVDVAGFLAALAAYA